MNVEKYNEDQEIEDRDLNEEVDLQVMNREEDDDFVLRNRGNDFDGEDESDDYTEDYDEDDCEEDDYGLGMYFDEPPRTYQRWKKTKRKRSHHSSYSTKRFRWDSDENDDW